MNTMTQSASIGRPKNLAKRQAVLNAAKSLFLQFGYDGSSMDAIAQEAGVSKLTVYNHFQDKEKLFTAAIENHCENQLPALDFDLPVDLPINIALYNVSIGFQSIIYSQEGLALHRLMAGMTQQNPNLVEQFFAAGPARLLALTNRLLIQAEQQKKLSIVDSTSAAANFLNLFCGHQHMRVLFELEAAPDYAQQQQLSHDNTAFFIRAYAVE